MAESLEAENARLRGELQALQERFDALRESTSERLEKLEDENEILAEANRLLLENEAAFQQKLKGLGGGSDNASSNGIASLLLVPDELLVPGPGITTQEVEVVAETHAFGNLLSVAAHAAHPELVLTGGADKLICAHDWQQKLKLCEFAASAPVLDLVFNPNPAHADFFVATFMDGKHGLYRLVNGAENPEIGWQIEEICLFHEHTRPGAMKAAWNSGGDLFATGASDKALHVFQCAYAAGIGTTTTTTTTCEKLKSFYFNGTVEAITFVPSTLSNRLKGEQEEEKEELKPTQERNELLAIAVRDDCYVHYVDCTTFEKERVNMNQDGIEHVSYTIMDLRVSPSGKYLLAATDSSRHFIFAIKSNVVLRNFYGHKAGPYSQPRAMWHPSEKYVLSNTEESGAVLVWCIASERVVDTISAHDALVRDFALSSTVPTTLFTVSYDKLLKVWSSALN